MRSTIIWFCLQREKTVWNLQAVFPPRMQVSYPKLFAFVLTQIKTLRNYKFQFTLYHTNFSLIYLFFTFGKDWFRTRKKEKDWEGKENLKSRKAHTPASELTFPRSNSGREQSWGCLCWRIQLFITEAETAPIK